MWQETPLRCGEGSQLILFGPAGDSGASLTLVSHGSRGRCLESRHVCQASARPPLVHSMCNSYLLFHTPPILKRHSRIPAPAKLHQTEMLKIPCTCFPDHFKCELMRFWHYSGERGAHCNGSHITFLPNLNEEEKISEYLCQCLRSHVLFMMTLLYSARS